MSRDVDLFALTQYYPRPMIFWSFPTHILTTGLHPVQSSPAHHSFGSMLARQLSLPTATILARSALWTPSQEQTSQNIKSCVLKADEDFSIAPEKVLSFCDCTDNGTNMVSACQSLKDEMVGNMFAVQHIVSYPTTFFCKGWCTKYRCCQSARPVGAIQFLC